MNDHHPVDNETFHQKLVVPAVRGFNGVQLTALFFAAQSLLLLFATAWEDSHLVTAFVLAWAGLYAWIAWGLVRAEKAAWHLAAFFAFVGIVLNIVSVACAPNNIADGDMTLLDAGGDILMLVLSILVWGYLRRPMVRDVFGVPTYSDSQNDQP